MENRGKEKNEGYGGQNHFCHSNNPIKSIFTVFRINLLEILEKYKT